MVPRASPSARNTQQQGFWTLGRGGAPRSAATRGRPSLTLQGARWSCAWEGAWELGLNPGAWDAATCVHPQAKPHPHFSSLFI